MYPYKFGDDSGSTENDFLNWKKDLWKTIYKVLPDIQSIRETNIDEENSVFDNKKDDKIILQKFILSETALNLETKPESQIKDFAYQKYAQSSKASILEIKELRQVANEQFSTVEIKLKLPQGSTYETAQNLVLYPKNTLKTISKIADYLKVDVNKFISINPKIDLSLTGDKLSFPLGVQLKAIFKKFVDIKGQIKFF